MLEKALDTRQAADRCGLSPRTLEKHRVTGDGPRYLKLGSAVRYLVEDIESYLLECRRRSTSDMGSKEEALDDWLEERRGK